MAVLLALVSALAFGAMSVALRRSLARAPDVGVAAVAMSAWGLAATLPFLALGPGPAPDAADLLVFAVAGALAPGGSQLFFTRAVREIGAARASVVAGTAPLVAVAVAVAALDEPLRLPIAVGTLLVVGGGFVLLGDEGRPERARALGFAAAFACAVSFALRDVVVRGVAPDTHLAPTAAAALALAAGGLLLLVGLLARRRGAAGITVAGVTPFWFPGILFGLSYVALFEAFERGRVGVVSPLVATEALWAVALAALFLRRHELVGRRLALGGVLVVAGGALVSAFR